jgi:hypothetical protein
MTLALAILLVLGVIGFTLTVRAKDLPPPEPESPVKHLEERKARIYDNLRDLQFEYRVGKLSDADYQRTKTDLQKELAETMAEIDAILGKSAPAVKTVAATAASVPAATTGTVCPHCKARFEKALKFCGECGKPMGEVTA